MSFRGYYRLRPDAQGRITIPEAWRAQLGAELVLVGMGDEIDMITVAQWEAALTFTPSALDLPPELRDFEL